MSTNHSRQGVGHTSDLETHPFASQNQPKSNYALPGGRAGSSNQLSRDPRSNHCSLCFTVCRARASSRVLPGARVRDSDPGALTPRTAIPPGCTFCQAPIQPLQPPQAPHLQPAFAEPLPSRSQQLLQTILPWQNVSREKESSRLPAVCSSRAGRQRSSYVRSALPRAEQ